MVLSPSVSANGECAIPGFLHLHRGHLNKERPIASTACHILVKAVVVGDTDDLAQTLVRHPALGPRLVDAHFPCKELETYNKGVEPGKSLEKTNDDGNKRIAQRCASTGTSEFCLPLSQGPVL